MSGRLLSKAMMDRMMARIAALALAALTIAAPTIAYSNSHATTPSSSAGSAPVENAPAVLTPEMRKQIVKNPQMYLQRAMNLLYQVAPGGVATRENIETLQLVGIARERLKYLSKVLVHDLNGDGDLSASEFDTAITLQAPSGKSQIALLMINADTNKDSIITFKELLAYANLEVEKNAVRRNRRQNLDLLAMDTDGDGQVTAAEIAETIDAVAELGPLGNTSRSGTAPACTAPIPPMGVEAILLSGYEGTAISTVAVSGLDSETMVATLTIESGDTPLYIFASAYGSMIWRIRGATERVWKFVAQPRRTTVGPGVGVTGLKQSQVAFVAPDSCFNYFDSKKMAEARLAKSVVTRLIRRNVDYVVAVYDLANIELPSGKLLSGAKSGSNRQNWESQIIKAGGKRFRFSSKGMQLMGVPQASEITTGNSSEPRTPVDKTTLRSLARFYQDGIIQIDVGDVIAPGPVQEYTVLPDQAGLLQLIAMGNLRFAPNQTYVIEKPISQFPAGLGGAHSVKFVLAKGVPMPKGTPGHSTVTLEETGECVVGGNLCNN